MASIETIIDTLRTAAEHGTSVHLSPAGARTLVGHLDSELFDARDLLTEAYARIYRVDVPDPKRPETKEERDDLRGRLALFERRCYERYGHRGDRAPAAPGEGGMTLGDMNRLLGIKDRWAALKEGRGRISQAMGIDDVEWLLEKLRAANDAVTKAEDDASRKIAAARINQNHLSALSAEMTRAAAAHAADMQRIASKYTPAAHTPAPSGSTLDTDGGESR
jgi:hypothetical protein